MPYFLIIDGEIKVILCRKKASQLWALPGKKPAKHSQIKKSVCPNSLTSARQNKWDPETHRKRAPKKVTSLLFPLAKIFGVPGLLL